MTSVAPVTALGTAIAVVLLALMHVKHAVPVLALILQIPTGEQDYMAVQDRLIVAMTVFAVLVVVGFILELMAIIIVGTVQGIMFFVQLFVLTKVDISRGLKMWPAVLSVDTGWVLGLPVAHMPPLLLLATNRVVRTHVFIRTIQPIGPTITLFVSVHVIISS